MANIPVNRQQWEQLSAEEQQSIVDILREAGSISESDTLIPSEDVPDSLISTIDSLVDQMGEDNTLIAADNACQRACTQAYSLAVARCRFLPLPQARAICYAASTAAYGVCLASC